MSIQSWYDEADFVPHYDDMIQLNDQGPDVSDLQMTLRNLGYTISVDGVFGPGTYKTLVAFQADQGIAQTGRVDARTHWRLEQNEPNPRFMTQDDVVAASALLEAPVARVMGLIEVETRGSGFLEDGRPKILFERHVMYRQLSRFNLDVDTYAQTDPNIVNTATGGYKGGAAEYDRLARAKTFDEDCALMSASWGLPQIMGYHFTRLGFDTVQQLVATMERSEREQLMLLVKFIQTDTNLWRAFRQADYETFTRGYNGRLGVRRGYHLLLQTAEQRYSAHS